MPSCPARSGSSDPANPVIRKYDATNAMTGPILVNMIIGTLFLGAMFLKYIDSFKINM